MFCRDPKTRLHITYSRSPLNKHSAPIFLEHFKNKISFQFHTCWKTYLLDWAMATPVLKLSNPTSYNSPLLFLCRLHESWMSSHPHICISRSHSRVCFLLTPWRYFINNPSTPTPVVNDRVSNFNRRFIYTPSDSPPINTSGQKSSPDVANRYKLSSGLVTSPPRSAPAGSAPVPIGSKKSRDLPLSKHPHGNNRAWRRRQVALTICLSPDLYPTVVFWLSLNVDLSRSNRQEWEDTQLRYLAKSTSSEGNH